MFARMRQSGGLRRMQTYNLGTLGVEAFFEALKALVTTMEEEERRAAREGLSEAPPDILRLADQWRKARFQTCEITV